MNCAHSHILVVTTGDCWSVFSDFSSCLLVFSFFVVSFCAVYVFLVIASLVATNSAVSCSERIFSEMICYVSTGF